MTNKETSKTIPSYRYPADGSIPSYQKFDLIDDNGSFIEPEFTKITNGEPQIEQILKAFYKDMLGELNSFYKQFTEKSESGIQITLPVSPYFESELDGKSYFTTVINPTINWDLSGIDDNHNSPLSLGYIDFTMDFKSDNILIDGGVCTPPTIINTVEKTGSDTMTSSFTTGWNAGVFIAPDLPTPTFGYDASTDKSEGFSIGSSKLLPDKSNLLRIFKHDVFYNRLCFNSPIGQSNDDAKGQGNMQMSIAINGTDMNVVKQKIISSDIYIQPYLKINEVWLLNFIENWKNESLREKLNFKPNKLNRFLKVWLVLSNLVKGEIKTKYHLTDGWHDSPGYSIKGGRTALNEVVVVSSCSKPENDAFNATYTSPVMSKEFEFKFPRNIKLPDDIKTDYDKSQHYDFGIPATFDYLFPHINDDKIVRTADPYWWHEHIDDSKQMSELLTHIPCLPIILKEVPHGII